MTFVRSKKWLDGAARQGARGWRDLRDSLGRFARNPAALVSSIVLLLMIVVAILGPVVAPYSPVKVGTGPRLAPPSRLFLFGTDQFGRDVFSRVLYGTGLTLQASIIAVVVAAGIGIPLGLIAGLRPTSWIGRAIMAGSILGFSLPTFWVGLVLIMFFSVHLGWLPPNGRGETVALLGVPVSFLTLDGLRHLAMPAANLAIFKLSLLVRLTRAGTREALLQDYVKFARAKGLPPRRVIGVHVLKNIMIPIVTVIGLELGSVIAFAVVTESIFAWPGSGKLLIDSINQLDRPVIVAYLLVTVTIFIAINFVVDVLYSALDPRVRLGAAASAH